MEPNYNVTESNSSKEIKYILAFQHIKGVCDSEPDLYANLANIAAILKDVFAWWWVGFYLVKGNELVLGPFQGPVACTRISYGKGVCGSSWQKCRSLVVPDVHAFPGHIACSEVSKSEIVVPVIKSETVCAVLDADSEHHGCFDETDKGELEKICEFIASLF